MSHTQFVELNGKKVQLTVGGEGPPLVYLHSAAGETEWVSCHAALAEHFTVHVPAHPGFALSTGLESIRDIQDMAWHYVDLFEAMGWNDVPVVGFSLGAWLAMEIAVLRPGLIRCMMLVAPAGVRLPELPYGEIFVDDLDRLRSLLFADPASRAVAEAIPTSLEDPRMLNWLRSSTATARVGWNPYLHNPRLPDHLHRIEVPVLLVWGDRDRVIPPSYAGYYVEQLPRARAITLPGVGHMVPFEAPEPFAQHALEFCASP